jgi:hypothetical protein
MTAHRDIKNKPSPRNEYGTDIFTERGERIFKNHSPENKYRRINFEVEIRVGKDRDIFLL